MVRPCRTRDQNARTRAESSAKATSTAIPSTVSRNNVKRGLEAKNARSKAGSFEKSGGLGKTPCENAKASTGTAIVRSKMNSTEKAAAIAGYEDPGTAVLVRKSRITSPPRAGTTELKP